LNDLRKHFNVLNEDFYECYTNKNFARQIIMRKNIRLLKKYDNVVGYIWISKYNKKYYVINSMYVNEQEDIVNKYKDLINLIPYKKIFIYTCEKNDFNYDVLKSIGFKKLDGTYEMNVDISSILIPFITNDLQFETLEKGKHEQIRCNIQNEVFKNDTRTPLNVNDIYFDEMQKYYFKDGAVLMKKNNKYIGYGQIIINNNIPTIVNVGVLKEYRGKGYGKNLIYYLFKILKKHNFEQVNLKVSSTNYVAINLYKSIGFTIKKEIHNWEYEK